MNSLMIGGRLVFVFLFPALFKASVSLMKSLKPLKSQFVNDF